VHFLVKLLMKWCTSTLEGNSRGPLPLSREVSRPWCQMRLTPELVGVCCVDKGIARKARTHTHTYTYAHTHTRAYSYAHTHTSHTYTIHPGHTHMYTHTNIHTGYLARAWPPSGGIREYSSIGMTLAFQMGHRMSLFKFKPPRHCLVTTKLFKIF
jgi:hypothetical protein